MASTAPAKSSAAQPLHNFGLSNLKWNTEGSSSQRRRTMKSPSRRHVSSPVSQSPFRDSSSPDVRGADSSSSVAKHSPIRVEQPSSSSSSKHPPIGKKDSEKDREREKEGPLIEYKRNHSKNLMGESSKNGGSSKSGGSGKVIGESLKSGKGNGESLKSGGSGKIGESLKSGKGNGEKKVKGSEGVEMRRSKILIKIPVKNHKVEMESPVEEKKAVEKKGEKEVEKVVEKNEDGGEEEMDDAKLLSLLEEEAKTWNLRPRKPIRKSLNVNGGGGGGGGGGGKSGGGGQEKGKAVSPSKNGSGKGGEAEGSGGGGGGGGGGEKKKEEKKKLNINISLTKEEIEEDIFAMTGAKPPRRPKKRNKNVQKQLDYVFPGLWLQGITPESYKVSENSLKN